MESVRIAVVSDTHGDIKQAVHALNRLLPLDFILHLGDYVGDGVELEKKIGVQVIGVKGNCDFTSKLPEDRLIEVADKKIFMTHGHHYDVKWNQQRLFYKGLEMNADIILFGHSHVPVHFEADGVLVINPGSTSHPRGNSEKSCALLEVGKNIKAELLILA